MPLNSLLLVLKGFDPAEHPRAPDGKFTTSGRRLFDLQNTLVEVQPKRMQNRAYGKALEHAGDIFRELTMHGKIEPFSKGYINEKTRRLRYVLSDPEFYYPLSSGDETLVQSMRSGWSRINPQEELATDAKELASLVLGRSGLALQKLNDLEEKFSKIFK